MISFPLQVAVIDDDATSLAVFRKLLSPYSKLAVTGFERPTEALTEVLTGRFQLVISDVQMPKVSGVELISALRSTPAGRSTFVAVITAKDSYIDAYACFQAGADAYIKKPIEPESLEQLIQTAISHFDTWNTVFKEITVAKRAKRPMR